MSSRYERRDSGGSRRDHRDRRRSPGPSSSRRSPSPKPRDDKELPEQFGRVPEAVADDDSNVLYRMVHGFTTAPLGSLVKCLEGNRKVKVWTRNFKEVRGICTGYILAFDKHWNLVMTDVDEVYLKPKKAKTPFLSDVTSAADFSELPKKMPKKKEPKDDVQPVPPEPAAESETEKSAEKGEKKKRKRCKKKGGTSSRRHMEQVFVRGDNIVMAAVLAIDVTENENENETPNENE